MSKGNYRVSDRICLHCGHDAMNDYKLHLPFMYGKGANKTYLCIKCYEKCKSNINIIENPKTDYILD